MSTCICPPTLRRRALATALGAAATLSLLPASGLAQAAFPNKPVTLVLPLAAGGAADALGRIWAEYASRQLGVPVVVDNRAGANGAVAAAYVAKQPADGYTLLMATMSNMALNQFTYKSLAYKASDFDGVGMLATTSQVLVANAGAGLRSVDELVQRARAKPGELAFGSAGTGNSTHLNVEILARHHQLKLIHVPYKGAAPALVGVIGGETQMMVDAVTSAVPQSRAGKVTPLLVFGPARIDAFPNVPTAAEIGIPQVVGGGWYALATPAGTPKAVIERLHATTVGMWNDAAAKAKLEAIYMAPMADRSVGAVKAAIAQDVKVWGPLVQDLGIQLD